MSVERVLALLGEAGFSVAVDAAGVPHLKGPAGAAAPEVLAAANAYRAEIVERLRPRPRRRVVLLAGGKDSEVERVLWESAEKGGALQLGEGRRLAREHAGRTVAAEWLDGPGWRRYWSMCWPGEGP